MKALYITLLAGLTIVSACKKDSPSETNLTDNPSGGNTTIIGEIYQKGNFSYRYWGNLVGLYTLIGKDTVILIDTITISNGSNSYRDLNKYTNMAYHNRIPNCKITGYYIDPSGVRDLNTPSGNIQTTNKMFLFMSVEPNNPVSYTGHYYDINGYNSKLILATDTIILKNGSDTLGGANYPINNTANVTVTGAFRDTADYPFDGRLEKLFVVDKITK